MSAPSLRAQRAESMATLPPPITATFLPTFTGVSYSGKRYAFIRLTLVRNSFAEYTPLRFSPAIFMNMGNPAPVPRKTASYPPFSSSSTVVNLSTTEFSSIFTPREAT